jgi:hypothetical protein
MTLAKAGAYRPAFLALSCPLFLALILGMHPGHSVRKHPFFCSAVRSSFSRRASWSIAKPWLFRWMKASTCSQPS